jgi:hypothetical protein
MKTAKILILAARILMSLGIGTAMAQSESASMPADFYGVVHASTLGRQAAFPRLQAGASDTDAARPGTGLPFRGDYSAVANPG